MGTMIFVQFLRYVFSSVGPFLEGVGCKECYASVMNLDAMQSSFLIHSFFPKKS